MKTLKRQEVIDRLIRDDYEIAEQEDFGIPLVETYLYNVLKKGFRGYENYSNKELLEEYTERIEIDPDKKIKII